MATVEESVPLLQAGTSLSRDEFLRRWELQPEIKFAELIGGSVLVPSPLSCEHAETDSPVGGILWLYETATPGTRSGRNATTLMLDDAPQPDDYLRILPEYGGQCTLEGKYLKGAPELIAEISATSAAVDLHEKRALYERAGVQEYVVVLLATRELRWHRLGAHGYAVVAADNDGVFRSTVFPGLWLDASALFAGDMPRVLARLQAGLASPEHHASVTTLAARRREI